MKEGILAEEFDAHDEAPAGSGGFTSSAAFPAIVALWFAALFGGGCLFLPPVLFDAAFGGSAPFGPNTRIVVALAAAGIGLLMGLFIASRIRTDDSRPAVKAPKPSRKRKNKAGARKPLDVRSALGLGPTEEDEDDLDADDPDDGDAFPLSDEHLADDPAGPPAPPIDDPYFASAWSDSDAYDPADLAQPDEEPEAARMPAPAARPQDEWDEWEDDTKAEFAPEPEQEPAPRMPAGSRYNPFSDFVKRDEEPDEPQTAAPRPEPVRTPRPGAFDPANDWSISRPEPAAPKASTFERPTEQPITPPEAAAPQAPPPPPAWPTPRAEEPSLRELGVAELVERLARALQGENSAQGQAATRAAEAPARSGGHRHESALAPKGPPRADIDRALRVALDRLSRLDDVA